MIRLFTLGLLCIVCIGCSASLEVHRIAPPNPDGADTIPGLAVNSNVPHEVIAVFARTPKIQGIETKQVETRQTIQLLPSSNELYVVGFRGAPFATRELKVEVHPDTSLRKVKLTAETTLPDQLGKLEEAIGTLATVRKEIREQKETKQKELKEEAKAQHPVALENEAIKRELLNLMLKANRDAAQRGAELPYPDAGQ